MEKIAKSIADIENWFGDLEEIAIKKLEDLNDLKNFHSTSMILFSIINRTIDIGEDIVAEKKLGFPSSYREIFDILKKNGIIDEGLNKKLSALVFYRNLFAHEYYSFTEKDVYAALKKVKGVRMFLKKTKEVLKEDQKKKSKKKTKK